MEDSPKIQRRVRRQYDPNVVVMPPAKGGWWRMLVIFLIVVLLFGGAVYMLFFSDYFKIKDVQITGDTKQEIVDGIKEMLKWDTEYMIMFNEQQFGDSVLKRWDDLAEVKVEKDWPANLKIELTEEVPVLIWNSEGKLFLVDKTGVVMKQIDEKERLELYNLLPVVGDLSGLPVEENKKIVSRSFISFIDEVKKGINESIKKEIEAFEIKETTFTLRVRMKEGYEVYFDTLRDPQTQIVKLNSFLKNQILVDDYIDLRVNGKVYYK
ncbi:MAG: cell division protein FtsQ/DivIB [Patescibacteria group bacterium]